ncbi:aconitase X catalytic domain-containing protein [Peptoniphilus equinus]|uniref:Aconitase X catalytic domain-containing protein n=1 Tax=Peptoniphilus equinus TaxID=3016343 RepID=A0ABY7QVF5_9FIRM|nr:aconitase X catalytic domain-containing protein [Peptoniphilus equinus]WBW50168.1 aconitase X catalytic domain-containing protein [Peptoniphilus equinus]
MNLNKEQQDMLDGRMGPGVQLAMKVQVAIGESFNAERLVPITRAHVALSNQDADQWLAKKMVSMGAKCKVPPTVNPGFSLCWFKDRALVDDEDYAFMKATHDAYRALGAKLTYNCTPYIDTNVPNYGEVIAFSESSATPYANAVWGARTNREGANSALFASITGYVPEYGLLLDENRKGTILVEVQAHMDNDYKYHMLGMCGKKIGHGIPVFVGLPKHISKEALRNLGAELNTSGAYDMYHIVGVTPEAPTIEVAFGGKEPERKVIITDDDLLTARDEISIVGNRSIDFVMFGCPHFTLDECLHIREQIGKRRLKVPMYILTSEHTKTTAKLMGLDEALEDKGAHIVPATCPDQPSWKFLKNKVGLTESPKCAYYPKRRGIDFVIRDLDTCIEGAITGEVQ